MNVNSPEFVQAWNEASQALLHLVQVTYNDGGGAVAQNIVASVISAATTSAEDADDKPVVPPQPVVHRTKVSELYTNSPIPMGDGVFIFKRLQDDPEGRFYKVTTYDDGSCEFELLTNISGECLQDLAANQASILAPAIACVTGTITENVKIDVTRPGKAVVDGRIVRIVEPMAVSFT